MTTVARAKYHLRQLRKMVARADDAPFLQLVWATDALQSGRTRAAATFITYPAGADDPSIGARLAVHRWELESLLTQLFLTPKQEAHPGENRILNCTRVRVDDRNDPASAKA
jgi:hypothetical protein